jgi:hypothetical protein
VHFRRYLTYPRQIPLGHDDEELRIFVALFSADEQDNAVLLVQFSEGPVEIILLLAWVNNILEFLRSTAASPQTNITFGTTGRSAGT